VKQTLDDQVATEISKELENRYFSELTCSHTLIRELVNVRLIEKGLEKKEGSMAV